MLVAPDHHFPRCHPTSVPPAKTEREGYSLPLSLLHSDDAPLDWHHHAHTAMTMTTLYTAARQLLHSSCSVCQHQQRRLAFSTASMAAREPRRSGGRGGFQWDSINHQWIKGARSSSPRVRAAQQYAELQRQEQERQEREEIQLASDAEVLESNAKPPSSTPASSSSDGTPAEAERPSGQRYVRGQDSSTLKVSEGGDVGVW